MSSLQFLKLGRIISQVKHLPRTFHAASSAVGRESGPPPIYFKSGECHD